MGVLLARSLDTFERDREMLERTKRGGVFFPRNCPVVFVTG